ncbi:unnamed protein product [Caenorhabditis bovis]|uniref:Saposin B-type domain-containing protein n=1 Tax=Caenorhabditis bovis TaxID=2654633 RepID=A0A8S1E5J9_9PELO|nr:unnamed protein product [Caenorhabditis bovis]
MNSIVLVVLCFPILVEAQNFSDNSNSTKNVGVVCDLCRSGFNLIVDNLSVLEHITENDLGALADALCSLAPRQLPIVDALCVVLRDNIIGALVKLIQGECKQCEFIASAISNGANNLKNITDADIIALVNRVCDSASSASIIESACEVVKRNVVEEIHRVIDLVEKNADPLTICKQLMMC